MISTLRLTTLVLACAALVVPAAANAGLSPYQFSGDTTSGPQLGWGGRYTLFNFRVDTAGTYLFSAFAAYDNVLAAFTYPFDILDYGNIIGTSNSDNGFTGHESFSASLAAGVQYTFLTTGAGASEFGVFNAEISGPGTVIALAAVPEPESYALLLAGLGLMGALARRTRTQRLSACVAA